MKWRYRTIFKDRLRQLRAARGLTQEAVGKVIGVGRTAYNRYELGEREPDYEKLCKLADFFGVTVDYLIGRVDKKYHEFLDELPEQLRDAGYEAIVMTRNAIRDGLSPDDLKNLLVFAQNYKK